MAVFCACWSTALPAGLLAQSLNFSAPPGTSKSTCFNTTGLIPHSNNNKSPNSRTGWLVHLEHHLCPFFLGLFGFLLGGDFLHLLLLPTVVSTREGAKESRWRRTTIACGYHTSEHSLACRKSTPGFGSVGVP